MSLVSNPPNPTQKLEAYSGACKTMCVVGEPLDGLGSERLSPVGPDAGDDGKDPVGEAPSRLPLPVEQDAHHVEEL